MELAAHPDRNAEPRRRGLTQASPTRNHGAAKPASAISAALGVGVRGGIRNDSAAPAGRHRKHAARVLRGGTPTTRTGARPCRRPYDDAAQRTLIVVWEAADRICGKRSKELLPTSLDAMGRHGHLDLSGTVHERLVAMNPATMDRALADTRATAGRDRRRPTPASAVKRSVQIRTFADRGDPAAGFAEADLVQHGGSSERHGRPCFESRTTIAFTGEFNAPSKELQGRSVVHDRSADQGGHADPRGGIRGHVLVRMGDLKRKDPHRHRGSAPASSPNARQVRTLAISAAIGAASWR